MIKTIDANNQQRQLEKLGAMIEPRSLARNLGFKIQSILTENDEQLLEAWYEYFGH